MKLGVDLSILDELQELSPKFTYHGKEVDPFVFFAEHSGISVVRLRLWLTPFDEEGNPYGGGTNDFEAFMRLAGRARDCGMSVLVDFHYSDFFVDPGRQRVPKLWRGLDFDGILKTVYHYTQETLLKLKDEDIDVYGIQVGNEISNGMLFPFGQVEREFDEKEGGGFKGLSMLLKSGIKACREVFPDAKIVCHIERLNNFPMQEWFLSSVLENGVDFDVIGESYYPYWHGTLREFAEAITKLSQKYKKPIWIVEAGYEYAQSLVEGHHCEYQEDGSGLFVEGNPEGRIPYPLTQEGQADYFKHFFRVCKEVGVDLVCYWEPAWILVKGNGWAKPAGQIYCGQEPCEAFNDWANETLFDFKGEATEAAEIFTQAYVDSLG